MDPGAVQRHAPDGGVLPLIEVPAPSVILLGEGLDAAGRVVGQARGYVDRSDTGDGEAVDSST
jgi:hypothetical protein